MRLYYTCVTYFKIFPFLAQKMTVNVENKRVICPSTGVGQFGTIVRNTLEAPYLLHWLSQALVGQRGTKVCEKVFFVFGETEAAKWL